MRSRQISLFLFLLVMISCDDEVEKAPLPTIFEIIEISSSSPLDISVIISVSQVSSRGIKELGVYYGQSPNAISSAKKNPTFINLDGNYQSSITVLASGKYYVTAYVVDNQGNEFVSSEREIVIASLTIDDFEPKQAGFGDPIILKGDYIGDDRLNLIVLIGDKEAGIIKKDLHEVTVTVPAGLTMDPTSVTLKTDAGDFVYQESFQLLKGVWSPVQFTDFFLHRPVLSFAINNNVVVITEEQGQHTWNLSSVNWNKTPLNDLPGGGFSTRGFSRNDNSLYVLKANNEIWHYAIGGSWNLINTLPNTLNSVPPGFAFSIGNEGFFGKYDLNLGELHMTMWKVGSDGLSVTPLNDYPGPADGQVPSAVANGKAYVIGGGEFIYGNFVYEYNSIDDSWSQLDDGPFPERREAIMMVINDKIYYGAGFSESNIQLKDFYEFDPSTYLWTRIADFPGSLNIRQTPTFTIGSHGYVFTNPYITTNNSLYRLELE